MTGPFRQFDLAAFERGLGADLEDSLFAEWNGRPAILATSIQMVR